MSANADISPTDMAQQVARFNEAGIHELMAQDSQAAIGSFTSALTIVQALLIPSVTRGQAARLESLREAPLCTFTLSGPVPGWKDAGSNLFVYTQAIPFEYRSVMVDIGESIEDAMSLSHQKAATAIIFNMALAFHHHGMMQQQVAKLQKACKLYSMCVDDMVPNFFPVQDQAIGSIITFGSLNNKAQIQYQFLGSKEIAADLAIQLQAHLAALLSVFAKDEDISPEFNELLLNIQMLLGYKSMASPVA